MKRWRLAQMFCKHAVGTFQRAQDLEREALCAGPIRGLEPLQDLRLTLREQEPFAQNLVEKRNRSATGI
jgi:hypothetical protein